MQAKQKGKVKGLSEGDIESSQMTFLCQRTLLKSPHCLNTLFICRFSAFYKNICLHVVN